MRKKILYGCTILYYGIVTFGILVGSVQTSVLAVISKLVSPCCHRFIRFYRFVLWKVTQYTLVVDQVPESENKTTYSLPSIRPSKFQSFKLSSFSLRGRVLARRFRILRVRTAADPPVRLSGTCHHQMRSRAASLLHRSCIET